eukprot:3260213-Rhodomonas_salina.1
MGSRAQTAEHEERRAALEEALKGQELACEKLSKDATRSKREVSERARKGVREEGSEGARERGNAAGEGGKRGSQGFEGRTDGRRGFERKGEVLTPSHPHTPMLFPSLSRSSPRVLLLLFLPPAFPSPLALRRPRRRRGGRRSSLRS